MWGKYLFRRGALQIRSQIRCDIIKRMPTRQRSQRVEAIILRHHDWGEADRILGLYTRESGKLGAIAKGARKLRSRKAGHIEPFTHVSMQLASGRDLYIVTQAETIESFMALRDNLVKLGYASYIVELLDRFTYEEGENRALFHLLTDTLRRLAGNEDPEQMIVHYYEIRLLDLLGFRPELNHCVRCETEIQPEDQFFSAEEGGALCPKCGRGTPGARPVSMQALKYMRHFQRSSYPDARRARISDPVYREMEILIQHYLTYILERNLNSPVFLRRVQGLISHEEAD